MRWTFLFLLVSFTCTAQTVQNFSLTNVSTGQYMSLADFSSKPGIIVIFTSTNCPYDNYYLSRIEKLTEMYKSNVPVLLINSNQDESMDQMKEFIKKNNLSASYLWDLEQKAMTALGGHKTPECLLLSPSGDKFTVAYRGAIDDNAQTESSVNKFYLKDAVEKLIAKEKIELKEIRPVGCSIR